MRSLWVGVSVLSLGIVWAQPNPQADAGGPQPDPPDRVASLNYVSGSVSFQPGGVDDWVPAEVNRPLTIGDHLWADRDGRAELHVGGTAIRLDSNTGISFYNLDDRTVQIRLSEGSLNVRLRDLPEDEIYEIDTPNAAFTLLRPGDYRVDANEDGSGTRITVRAGAGEINAGGQTYQVAAGQQGEVTGANEIRFRLAAAPERDPWDDWCNNRDAREDRSMSARYVGRDMPDYQDLDQYGTWTQQADYGPVWYPRDVPADWAPYHYGHWIWVEPWGWTWVDDDPWGFAPFHYGRWAFFGARWGWIPGPVVARPIYAPALVAWVGGPNFRFSIMAGRGPGIAWFPLGPRDVYIPGYHASTRYIEQVNITNARVDRGTVVNVYERHVTNISYGNLRAPRAITGMPDSAFVASRGVRGAGFTVSETSIRSAPVERVAPFVPGRESVLGRQPAGRVARPPQAVYARPVVARAEPAPRPLPFAVREQALRADPGHPLAPERVNQLRAARPAAEARPAFRSAGRVGQPAAAPRNLPAERSPAAVPNQPERYGRPAQPETPGQRRNEQGQHGWPQQPNRPERNARPAQPETPAARPNVPEQPERQPETRQPERQPETRQPERQPETRQPERQPETRQPERQPETRQPERQPETRQPERQPETRQPERQPETRQPERYQRPATPETPAQRPTPTRPETRPQQTPARQPEARPAPSHTREPAARGSERPSGHEGKSERGGHESHEKEKKTDR
jgi:Family of unknown function (DUF6600)/FecR protein